ncbi:MAG: 2-C-methyl-D-erythritol 4-phosphate cytidylyltransferase [Peptococcaceae bacterium]|nr:MAG: 2-C-methyl-D-erythritol 4-phosphate cytidylyltransferase [Peptococcaceae bacterium]
MAKVAAVIPAAGQGRRMGTAVKKPFLLLGGFPVIYYTLRVMEESLLIDDVVLVVSPDEKEQCRTMVLSDFSKVKIIVTGGEKRQDSVYNGLLALSADTRLVVIHDAVRPFLGLANLQAVVRAAETFGAATLAVPVKDTVKVAGEGGFINQTLPRNSLWLAQTPQAFQYSLIVAAHRRAREIGYSGTDDAGLVELAGQPVKLVFGSYENIKITTPEDLITAEALLRRKGE